jgi:hypothetical protein
MADLVVNGRRQQSCFSDVVVKYPWTGVMRDHGRLMQAALKVIDCRLGGHTCQTHNSFTNHQP